jgi:hypothetical protein
MKEVEPSRSVFANALAISPSVGLLRNVSLSVHAAAYFSLKSAILSSCLQPTMHGWCHARCCLEP